MTLLTAQRLDRSRSRSRTQNQGGGRHFRCFDTCVRARFVSFFGRRKDAEECVSIRFNPLRAGFKRSEGDPGAVDTFCPDVLNTGVK